MDNRVTKKIIIDAYRGGDDIGSSVNGIVEKDYNLELSKYIYDRLRTLGIPVTMTRDSDETLDMDNRVNRIKSIYGTGNDVIVISNALTTGGDGAEIVYALRNSSGLSQKLANELATVGIDVSKYYQRRLPSDTSKDYNQLIRDTANNEALIIYYGNIDNTDEANYLKNNLESVGEAVVIALANYLNVNYNPIEGSDYYIVKKGDNLYSIASAYNTTVSELKAINNLSSNNLSIGKILKLPTITKEEMPNNGEVIYIVKSGDNLYKIANSYNTTVDELKAINNLISNNLSIGQKLKIPSNDEANNYVTYQVVGGDTLYSIAKKYNTTTTDIKNFNNLSSNLLSIGQVLKIPTSTTDTYLTYKVVSGDNLYSIARIYNTTVDDIKTLNSLSSNNLSIGQVLKIPNFSNNNYINYIVVSGDSLYSIAKKYNTTVDEIKILNNLDSNLLSIGQVLKIPA